MSHPMKALQNLLDTGTVHGVSGHVASSSEVLWQGAVGELTVQSPLRLYSMTKLVGAIGAMMLSERGLFDWDAPVGDIVPEFDDLPVLIGFEDEKPVLRAQRSRATYADLAKHTSGSAYALWQPDLMRYFQLTGEPIPESGSQTSWQVPLVFDPGQGWAYGFGPDWLGRALERLTGTRLPELFERLLFKPLELNSMTFAPSENMRARLPRVMRYKSDGTLSAIALNPPEAPEIYGLGNALYGSAGDYLRLLQLLLRGGEGLLSPTSVAKLRTSATVSLPVMTPLAWPAAEFDIGSPVTQSLGAMVTQETLPRGRHAGSLFWAGFLNTHYWVDFEANIAGVFATQILPFAQPDIVEGLRCFESSTYALFRT